MEGCPGIARGDSDELCFTRQKKYPVNLRF